MTSEVDIVIVGGGAAGIGAALGLVDSGLSVLMIEASSRLGGRAWTSEMAGLSLDLGCGWLHSGDRNAWTRIAQAKGVEIDRREPAWGQQYADLGVSQDEQRNARKAFMDWEGRLAGVMSGSDCAGDALGLDCTWKPYVQAICGFASGASPENMSATDYLTYSTASTYRNWRVPTGYGRLISSSLPSNMALRLSTPVQAIAEGQRGAIVSTPAGDIAARAVILTVSTAVLAGETIKLPVLFDPWRAAANQLPLGRDEKLFFELIGDTPFESETHLFGNFHDSKTCTFYIRPFGRPVIECFLGGDSAQVIEREGAVSGFALALEQIIRLMGADIRRKLRPLAASAWSRMDRIGGAYSYARPKHANARHFLAQPCEGRFFFAGEATHSKDFSTAHGAYESGIRAAQEAMAMIFNSSN